MYKCEENITNHKSQITNHKYIHALFPLLIIVFLSWCGQAYAQVGLRTSVPELCYECHAQLKESLSQANVHLPFKQGKCTVCHNSHTSNIRGLMRDDINDICLGCHEDLRKLFKKAEMHGALKKGPCTDCHFAHSSSNKHLLVKDEKELCWGCHEPLKEKQKQPLAHAPFKKGECSSCHNPHASVEEYQLRALPNKICKNCHEPRCNVNGVSITFATKTMDCVSCHSGHGSDVKGLLGPYGHSLFINKSCDQCHNPFVQNKKITTKLSGPELCFSCHPKDPEKFKENDPHWSVGANPCIVCHTYHASKKKSYTVSETGVCFPCHEGVAKKIASMRKAFPKRKGIAVKDKKCFECHTPLHSRQPFYFRTDEITMCGRCHSGEHQSTHPIGAGVIDPRNGKAITCVSCHSMHAPKSEYLLHYDRKRQLCIQCHKK